MLVIQNLSFKYKDKKIINNFSYTFNNGSIYSIIAKSGQGKTTLLRIISKNINNYDGTIFLNSRNIKKLKNYTFNNVSYVYQDLQLFNELTGLENVLMPFKITSTNINSIIYKAKGLFSYFEVMDLLNMKVKNMSGGQKQKIAIIKALCKDFDILLLDEPTSSINKEFEDLFLNYLNSIKSKKIIIMVTHNLELANKTDVIIDLELPYKNKMGVVESKIINEKNIDFKNLKTECKKLFLSKKLFKYILSSLLSMGLIFALFSFILKDFISDIKDSSFEIFNYLNNITVKSNVKETKSLKEVDNVIYYEGIESSLKENIKENNNIVSVEFNSILDIDNVNFVFDNYLTDNNYITLKGPIDVEDYLIDNNYLQVNLDDGNHFKIYLDYINSNTDKNDMNYTIYSNNISYLSPYFNNQGIDMILTYFLFTNNTNDLYSMLINDINYIDYYFIKEQYYVLAYKIDSKRLTKDMINTFIINNNISDYIYSDNTNTYIDFNSGFIYAIYNDDLIQVAIDNSLLDNTINVSKSIDLNNEFIKQYKINKIKDNVDFSLIFMNSNTFNLLNDNLNYFNLAIPINSNIENKENLLAIKNEYKSTSFKALNYITYIMQFYSIIIIILAFISSYIVFKITNKSKQKYISMLLRLGVYRKDVFNLILFDPIVTILKSTIISFFASISINIILYKYYSCLTNIELAININIKYYIYLLCSAIFYIIILLPIHIKSMKS